MSKLDAIFLLLSIAKAVILSGILYVVWWGANHGIFPIGG